MKFLIVDDSKAMQKVVMKTMHKAGYQDHQYEFADNGLEAYELIKSWGPDLVLSDWHMPQMDGMALLKKIQSEQLNVRIGLVTTERSESSIKEALNAGALFLVSKPFTPEQLAEAVMDAVEIKDEQPDKFNFPSLNKTTEILGALIPQPLFAAECPAVLNFNYPFIVGLYSSPNGKARALCVVDHLLSCFMGAALSESDADLAYDAIGTLTIPSEIYDNVMEVLNVISAMFYDPDSQQDLSLRTGHLVNVHVNKLENIIHGPHMKRMDLLIDVPEYGSGKMSLFAL
ncbi:MAG: response regulator [Kangiellaceae bacterium]|nr:response regulator [Kangiellaceae bacterium]